MSVLANLAKMTVTGSPGTSAFTLNAAVSGYLTFGQSGVVDAQVVTYAGVEGASRECGVGVYTASGTTLTRTVLASTNSNALVNFGSGVQVSIVPAAEDFTLLKFATATPTGTGTVSFTGIPTSGFSAIEIIGSGRSTTSGTGTAFVGLQFNGDTGANYANQAVGGNGNGTPFKGQGTGGTTGVTGEVPKDGCLANAMGEWVTTIPFYAGGARKKALTQYSMVAGAAITDLYEIVNATEWSGTAAINRIDLILASGNWKSPSQINLYLRR